MTELTAEKFDLVVVGGGPSGATLAALVAKQGHRVLLLEKEKFPRYQIGESLLPSTVHGVCKLLGVAEEVEAAGFVKKLGGTFRWGANPDPWTFTFAISPKIAGPTSHAFQVERMKFDQILLDNARRVGVQVREECSVNSIIDDGDRVTGLRYTDVDGTAHEISATIVADCSGNRSRIHQHTGGKRVYSEFFQNVALFGYFEGGKRLPAPRNGNILCEAFEDGWFWYIPLSDELTSVGAVIARERVDQIQGDSEKALFKFIERSPLIQDMLSEARRVTEGPYGEIRVRKDYSYCDTAFWKPGMVLAGDAACFVDPVFSSGVHLATYSGLLAARSINSVLSGEVDERRSFTEFEKRYRREYGLFYEFLISFYDLHHDEQSYFWSAKKLTSAGASDAEAFVELVGGAASGDAALTAVTAGRRLASAADQLAQAVDSVRGQGGGDVDKPAPLLKAPIIGEVMQEGAQVQARAALGDDLGDEKPLFVDGLVPSGDGMTWKIPVS
ncbi:tryptophan 7-halogenase [Streptomyces cyanogenus]|uniref:FAD-dependent oxidoreductase LodB n=1 Tax=Streptomyces cyanogenus TaxID=80860 RepID=A0ABX7TJH8_STRCY|nr:tryptophan 7-halogenase [Streptomyces cyanogenus]QTD96746.1 Putative FAD-dependent oxidoreductase LodB [Streptomyces cyanogenus]